MVITVIIIVWNLPKENFRQEIRLYSRVAGLFDTFPTVHYVTLEENKTKHKQQRTCVRPRDWQRLTFISSNKTQSSPLNSSIYPNMQ